MLAMLAVVCISGVACDKDDKEDDNDEPTGNNLKLDGNTHELGGGILENYGTDSSGAHQGTNIDLWLYTSGIEVLTEEDSSTGEGYVLYFEIFTTAEDHLAPGTYTYALSGATNTFDIAESFKVKDGEDVESSYLEYSSGTLTIAKSGNTYTLDASLGGGGKTATAHYEGSLTMVE